MLIKEAERTKVYSKINSLKSVIKHLFKKANSTNATMENTQFKALIHFTLKRITRELTGNPYVVGKFNYAIHPLYLLSIFSHQGSLF